VTKVNGLRPAALGNSDKIAVGDPVIAVGSPLGLAGTVTSGIVSALNRPVDASGSGTDTNAVIDAIQTDAAINPGNSGGPLVDSSGAVIGVNSAIATLGAGSSPFGSQDQAGSIGLGFAIPSNGAKDIASQIIARGFAERPVIGVNLNLAYTGTPEGALIGCPSQLRSSCTAVQSGGPGEKAGLREGDVIVAVDGKATTSPDEVIIATRQHKPGDTVRITVIRDGSRQTFTVKLGKARA
jgi:putative serine protease PepD